MSKTFQKTVEDFKCANCGFNVSGSGYTNHCPKCLYSRHVDINPGDRLESCRGLMKPMSYDKKGDEYTIIHKCLECGIEKKNKMSKDDDIDVLISLS